MTAVKREHARAPPFIVLPPLLFSSHVPPLHSPRFSPPFSPLSELQTPPFPPPPRPTVVKQGLPPSPHGVEPPTAECGLWVTTGTHTAKQPGVRWSHSRAKKNISGILNVSFFFCCCCCYFTKRKENKTNKKPDQTSPIFYLEVSVGCKSASPLCCVQPPTDC